MINLDTLKTEFDKRQQEREQNFTLATVRAQVMLADLPADLLPTEMALEAGDNSIFVRWSERMYGHIEAEGMSLSSLMHGFPDPTSPTTSAELLVIVVAPKAYVEPCETCTRCGQTVPTRQDK